ncbi:MAG: hypothetical protein IKU60_01500 [Clostridia bacterium]|nr:hypothetical protein [Clostridia bacterium]
MNWSKIKNIMIIILVLINLFLLMNMALGQFASQALPEGVGESFENLLEKSGITIKASLVPSSYETRSIVSAAAFDIDYLTEIFIGKQTISYVSEGDSLVIPADDKKLIIKGEKMEFTTLKKSAPKVGRDILNAVKELGLGNDGMYYDPMTGYVKLKIDSVSAEGVYLDVYLDENGDIASLSGVWPKIKITGTDAKVSLIGAINSICTQLPGGSHITDIEKVYLCQFTDDGYKVKNAWRVYNQGRGYLCW